MGIQSDKRRFEYYAKLRVYCPNCGHSNTIPVQIKSKICNWCGEKVYREKKFEFEDKLRIAQIKGKSL